MFRLVRKALPFAIPFLGLAALPARSEEETTELEALKIDLWPEYDRPSTLVMYRFRLKAGASLSLPVAVPIPPDVGEPHAVAWRDEKGSLFVADFSRQVEGSRAVVLARLGSREGQLEFYMNLDVSGQRRSVRFVWPGGVDIGSLSFQIQRPRDATEFQVAPAPIRQWEGEDGLGYALVEMGRLSASDRPSIDIGYEKSGDALSAVEERPPSPAPPTAEAEPSSPIPWWLLAAGGALLGLLGASILFFQRGSKANPPPTPSALSEEEQKPIFCHECGTRGGVRDSFCRECGTRLFKR